MKTKFFTAILCLYLIADSAANSIVLIDVTTNDKGVTYSINREQMTIAELSSWMKDGIAQFGDEDPILIQPDSQTTFSTVFALLTRLTECGVKHFEILAVRKQTKSGSRTMSLVIESNQLKTRSSRSK